MNLLPKTREEFTQKDYWNTFFKKRGKKSFEWYGEYPELCGHLHKYIKSKDDILVIGCGNSTLSSDLYDVGYKSITNIDISKIVIKQMLDINTIDRPDMKFLHMDVLEMNFSNDSFSVVLDKGTLDALMPDNSEEVIKNINTLFENINKVLRIGGRYVCISLLQEHILKYIVNYISVSNWMLRIIRCLEAERKNLENGELSMPVFVIVCTKTKPMPFKVFEVCHDGEKIQRFQNGNDLINTVKSIQQTSLVCSGLNRCNIADLNEISLDLFKPGDDKPRYTVFVLDQKHKKQNGKYAAFIVPQGRELDWLFSTPEGRKELLKSASFDRLAIVTLQRGHEFENWDSVKTELSESIKTLAPFGLTESIPYLSLGSDVGKRTICHEGSSDISGPYVIEDIHNNEGETFRRLIFLNNQFIIQSEAKLKFSKSKHGKKFVVDTSYLACEHHTYMILGIQLSNELKKQNNALIIGLGGGGLCSFIQLCFPKNVLTAIDIDPEMINIATNWFGMKVNDKLIFECADGIKYIYNSVQKEIKYNAILFDVNSKDTSIGLSCPPKQFLEDEFLEHVILCLKNEGVLILNLVCRDINIRTSVVHTLSKKFLTVASYKLDQDLNEIFYCLKKKCNILEKIKIACKEINNLTKNKKLVSNDFIDNTDLVQKINICN